MSAFLRKLFERYARRLIIGKGEGIRQIPNKDRVRLMADNIYKDFKKVFKASSVLVIILRKYSSFKSA